MAKNEKTSRSRMAATVVALMAVATIGSYEGLRLYSYRDVIGVWTYCYGETKGAKPGMKFTKDQCDVLFIESLAGYEKGMRSCLNEPDALPDKTYVAALSLTYNIGIGGFCKSSVAREFNNRNWTKACDNFLRFNKAGGRVVQGLVTRRKQERLLCYAGLKDKIITLEDPPPAEDLPTEEVQHN